MVQIAVIQGDGIGKEVMPEAEATLLQAAETANFKVEFEHFDQITPKGFARPVDVFQLKDFK